MLGCQPAPQHIKKTTGKQAEMAGYDNIKGKGNRFSSTNQPKNRGRKPKLYTLARKVYHISIDEWRDVALYLLQCTRKEVESIAQDESTPIWVVNICRALYKDAGKGSTATLEELFSRLWGKPGQSIDITSKGNEFRALTVEVMDGETVRRLKKIAEGGDENDPGIQ